MFQKVTKELKKNKVLKAGIGYTIGNYFLKSHQRQLPPGSGHRPGYRHCAAAPAGGAAPRPGHGGLCLSQRQE